MPSTALTLWQNNRVPRLSEVEAQCNATINATMPNVLLFDENLRGYVLALSAHFQGFCRDLCTEACQLLAAQIPNPNLQVLFQTHFTSHRKLDTGNPNLENLKADFKRFGVKLDLPAADPANQIRLESLSKLNDWRNIAAHQGNPASCGPLNLPVAMAWRYLRRFGDLVGQNCVQSTCHDSRYTTLVFERWGS